MNFSVITIIGLGFIGGSLGLALKEVGFMGEIVGVSTNEANLAKALDAGMIDRYTTSADKGVKDADLIILATNVGLFVDILSHIGQNIKKGAIVSDVGSVKGAMVEKLESLMPQDVYFVGAHPIAGGERAGVAAAKSGLYRGAKCIITPTNKTEKHALDAIVELWRWVGAKTVLMDCHEHDRRYAALSHLPHLLAFSLINAVDGIDKELITYAGQGFKDLTRIALSPSPMWRDICIFNKENILEMITVFEATLFQAKQQIEHSDWNSLNEAFHKARLSRERIEKNTVKS